MKIAYTALVWMILWMILTPVFGVNAVWVTAVIGLIAIFGRYGAKGLKTVGILAAIPVVWVLWQILGGVIIFLLNVAFYGYAIYYLIGTIRLMAHRPLKQALWVLAVRVVPAAILYGLLTLVATPQFLILAIILTAALISNQVFNKKPNKAPIPTLNQANTAVQAQTVNQAVPATQQK